MLVHVYRVNIQDAEPGWSPKPKEYPSDYTSCSPVQTTQRETLVSKTTKMFKTQTNSLKNCQWSHCRFWYSPYSFSSHTFWIREGSTQKSLKPQENNKAGPQGSDWGALSGFKNRQDTPHSLLSHALVICHTGRCGLWRAAVWLCVSPAMATGCRAGSCILHNPAPLVCKLQDDRGPLKAYWGSSSTKSLAAGHEFDVASEPIREWIKIMNRQSSNCTRRQSQRHSIFSTYTCSNTLPSLI